MEATRNTYFPVTRSILSSSAIITEILSKYDLGPCQYCQYCQYCQFLNFGLNDTYLVKTTKGIKYILRIYRLNWRSVSEISYEIEALSHICEKGIPVSKPIAQKSGDVIQTVVSPEGERYAVLFSFAPGKNISYEKDFETTSYRYETTVTHIHNATQDFVSKHHRFQIDLNL
jgi:Ser/Thr protein kinase RdoA (MazF antagonist)